VAGNIWDLTGKVALVTGGSQGLGKAMARGLAEAGADIILASRRESELKAALTEVLQGTSRRGQVCVADLSRREEAKKLAKNALAAFGRIDILINNAGTNKPQSIDSIDDETWDMVLELNLSSIMALTRAVVPDMKKRRWGRIIHISSVMGFVSKEKRNIYSATKSALLGLARANALDLGEHGITVNCIAPGPFLTELPGSLLSDAEKKAFDRSRSAAGQRCGQLHHRADDRRGWGLSGALNTRHRAVGYPPAHGRSARKV
jgi:NAD(P)-dependent dehydrogenase (short-subunit alcohol dehydrogenase family)